MKLDIARKAMLAGATIGMLTVAQDAATQTTDAQTETPVTQEEMQEADRAAETMIGRLYVREVPTYWTSSEVIARLQALGYTNISDFDVEWNHNGVEAVAPNGEEVEIEVDPVTAQILDVEENWF